METTQLWIIAIGTVAKARRQTGGLVSAMPVHICVFQALARFFSAEPSPESAGLNEIDFVIAYGPVRAIVATTEIADGTVQSIRV